MLADPEVEAHTVHGLVPLPSSASGPGKPARGGVVMELRKLRLMNYQSQLRVSVSGGGATRPSPL